MFTESLQTARYCALLLDEISRAVLGLSWADGVPALLQPVMKGVLGTGAVRPTVQLGKGPVWSCGTRPCCSYVRRKHQNCPSVKCSRCNSTSRRNWRHIRSPGRVCCALRSHNSAVASKKWQERLWSAVNFGACLASAAGAVAFFLTSEALLLGLPTALPLIALLASKQREKLQAEVSRVLCSLCSWQDSHTWTATPHISPEHGSRISSLCT